MRISCATPILLGFLAFSLVDGFTPSSLQKSITQSNAFVPWATRVEDETKTKDSRMTDEDEDFFFGQEEKIDYPSRRRSGGGGMPPNELDLAQDPLVNQLRSVRDNLQTCPQLWTEVAKLCPDKTALIDQHLCDDKINVNFKEMDEIVKKSAAVFADLGVKKGNNVAVLGENSARWLMIDHGIQLAGGATAVRGADAPVDELLYIYEHSDSAGVAVIQGPKLLQKLAKNAQTNGLEKLGLKNDLYGAVKTIVLMHREKMSDEDIQKIAKENNVEVKVFADMLEDTAPIEPNRLPELKSMDTATIVYTSGTTGRPKGVMLSHANLIHQMSHRLSPSQNYEDSEPLPGDLMVSLLPVWHITERTFELWMSSRGCAIVYSSIRTFKKDMALHQPQWMVLVPRVLEKIALGVQDKFAAGSAVVQTLVKLFTATSSVAVKNQKIAKGLVVGDEAPGLLETIGAKITYAILKPVNAIGNKLVWSKVKDGFGGRLKVIISGGSALAGSLEEFYENVGMNICVGYGLTECSPLISYRRADANLVTAGCAGKACMDTELRVVDPAAKANERERPALEDGEVGVVVVRGPQVMQGYYKNAEATGKAIDRFGWFDTGDLGRINPATGDLILTGRAKDTIVLSNGENIEPGPIEDAILGGSSLVEQVMLTGQDGRRLVAIAVLRPEELGKAGFLEEDEAKKLQETYEELNNPKCLFEDGEKYMKELHEVVPKLQANKDLKKALMTDIKAATSQFRAWEQVGDVFYTIEPFAMANGLLTQSFKVKRPQVLEKHGADLPK